MRELRAQVGHCWDIGLFSAPVAPMGETGRRSPDVPAMSQHPEGASVLMSLVVPAMSQLAKSQGWDRDTPHYRGVPRPTGWSSLPLDCGLYRRTRVYFERDPYLGRRSEDASSRLWCYNITLDGDTAPRPLPRVHAGNTAPSAIPIPLLRRSMGSCGLERGRRVFRSALTPPRPRRCTAASSSAAVTAGDLFIPLLGRKIGSCGLKRGRRVTRLPLTPTRPRRYLVPFASVAAGDLSTPPLGPSCSGRSIVVGVPRLRTALGKADGQRPIPQPKLQNLARLPRAGRAVEPPSSPAEGETNAHHH